MERIIVTGATGFIGRQTIRILQNYDFEIHAITSKDKREDLADDIFWHSVDLFDYPKVADVCREIEATNLLHLAWVDDHKERMTSLVNIAWVEASLHLTRRFADNGGQRMVLGGSCAEYDWRYGYCNEELTPTEPGTLYGECKSSLNRIIEKYSQERGIHYSCGRIFSVYGPYELESRLVPHVINSLLAGRQAEIKHPNQIRDYLHVTDVADALVRLLISGISGPVNIASGQAKTLREIAELIGRKLDKKELIIYGNENGIRDEASVVFADISRLRKEVGWVPKYDLDKGINTTIDWWKDQLKIKAK